MVHERVLLDLIRIGGMTSTAGLSRILYISGGLLKRHHLVQILDLYPDYR